MPLPNVSFKIARHSAHADREVVEIYTNGCMVGVMYPQPENNGVKIVSTHIAKTEPDSNFSGTIMECDGSSSYPQIPSIHIAFKPGPWQITPSGKVLKNDDTPRDRKE